MRIDSILDLLEHLKANTQLDIFNVSTGESEYLGNVRGVPCDLSSQTLDGLRVLGDGTIRLFIN